MTAPTQEPLDEDTAHRPWVTVLAWSCGVVAAVDAMFQLLVGTIIPPIAVSTLLLTIGVVVLLRWRRTGIAVIAVTTLLMLVGGAQFAIPHLDQPSSFVDWTHAVVGLFGRVVILVAAIGAWRRASAAGARRVGVASAGLFALTLLVAAVATAASDAVEPADDDVVTIVDGHAFEPTVVVTAGQGLFVDNKEMFRHTFTVRGAGIDLDLPANGAARTVVDLPAGIYDVRCDIPGHEAMEGTLEVRG